MILLLSIVFSWMWSFIPNTLFYLCFTFFPCCIGESFPCFDSGFLEMVLTFLEICVNTMRMFFVDFKQIIYLWNCLIKKKYFSYPSRSSPMKQYGQHLIVENFQYLSKKRLSPMVLWLTIKKKLITVLTRRI